MSRKEWRRGLANIEDSVDTSIQQLEDYIKKRGERLITVTRNNIDNRTETTSKKWEEKQLCGRHIISECSKSTQKEYKNRHDWVGKIIHWELCKKLKLDHTNKWQMHKLESLLENETHKLPWDFEIQTDHLISARQPYLVIINKKRKLVKLWNLLFRLATK